MLGVQRRLAVVLVVAAFGAAAGAFLYAQVSKTSAAPIYGTDFAEARFFSPDGDGQHDQARLRFRLRATQRIDVDVVDGDGRRVRRLVAGETRQGRLQLAWDGRDEAGVVVPDGAYAMRVHLYAEGHDITLPASMTVDTTPPTVQAAVPDGAVLVPGLAGRGAVAFPATASEPVSLRLRVLRIGLDGRARSVFLERAPGQARSRTVTWSGEVGRGPATGQPDELLAPGSYVVGWVAVDRAGNRVSAPAELAPGRLAPAGVVRVETVALGPDLEPRTAYPTPTVERLAVGPTDDWPPAAGGAPGLLAVHAAAGGHDAWAPAAVPGTETLVVVPTYSWALRNPYDADGNGYPDGRSGTVSLAWPYDPATLDRLRRLGRVLAPTVEPGAYGAITDAALETDGVPEGTATLVLAHVRAWSDGLAQRLRDFQADGGRVVLRKSLLDRHVERDGDTLRLAEESVLTLP